MSTLMSQQMSQVLTSPRHDQDDSLSLRWQLTMCRCLDPLTLLEYRRRTSLSLTTQWTIALSNNGPISALSRTRAYKHEISSERIASSIPSIFCRAVHSRIVRRRSALSTTDIEEALIAKAATIGLIRMPKRGYNMPAATGTPPAL